MSGTSGSGSLDVWESAGSEISGISVSFTASVFSASIVASVLPVLSASVAFSAFVDVSGVSMCLYSPRSLKILRYL